MEGLFVSKVIVWGAGNRAKEFFREFECIKNRIVAVTDNNKSLWGKTFRSMPVISPLVVSDYASDSIIVVASYAFGAILRQLRNMGYPEDRVFCYPDAVLAIRSELELPKRIGIERFRLNATGWVSSDPVYVEIGGKVVEDVPPVVSACDQSPLVEKLLYAYLRAKECISVAPIEYHPGENWDTLLCSSRPGFYQAVQARDVEGLAILLNNFFRNEMGESIIGGESFFRMFAQYMDEVEPWLQHNMNVLMYSLDRTFDIAEVGLPPIGNPYGYDVGSHIVQWNAIPNFYRAEYSSHLLKQINRFVVVEIGGGFGCFAYFLLKKDNPVCYINFDLPENLIISSYYLSMAFPEKRTLLFESPEINIDQGVIEDYDIILMPNYMLPRLGDRAADLVINTISFSEMEMTTIEEYHRQISRVCRQFFYHENIAVVPVGYKGYPSTLFPSPIGFKKLSAGITRWMGMDAYAKGHVYKEYLYVKEEALCLPSDR